MRSSWVATLLAFSATGTLAVAGETAVPQDWIKKAEEQCSSREPFERPECEQQLLSRWADPAEQAKYAAARRYADDVLRLCTSERFTSCMEKRLSSYPLAARDLAKAFAIVDNTSREMKAEETRLAGSKATCARRGIREGTVRIGMSAQAVRDCGWGTPDSINRTITASRISEQWVYGTGQYLYFDNGKLTAIQD